MILPTCHFLVPAGTVIGTLPEIQTPHPVVTTTSRRACLTRGFMVQTGRCVYKATPAWPQGPPKGSWAMHEHPVMATTGAHMPPAGLGIRKVSESWNVCNPRDLVGSLVRVCGAKAFIRARRGAAIGHDMSPIPGDRRGRDGSFALELRTCRGFCSSAGQRLGG